MTTQQRISSGLIVLLSCFSCAAGEEVAAEKTATAIPMPPPTEHRLDLDYEKRNKSARKQWQAAMHRTAPGVDWKAIEKQNGLAAMSRRNTPGGQRALPPGQWRELGSRNQAGRMHSSVLVRGTTLYSGSNLGGVWVGARNGTNWTPLGDNLWGGGKIITVVPGATQSQDVILRSLSGELHRSDDQGATWDKVTNGLSSIGSLGSLITMDNGDVLLMGRDGSVSIGGWGIYASQDAGLSFSLRYDLGTGGRAQLWKHRTQAGVVLVLQSDQLSVSNDNGHTVQSMGTAMPVSLSSPKLRASEATNPPTVYVIGKNGNDTELWRTVDGGMTWDMRRTIINYWGPCQVSISDPDMVAWGEVDCFVTYNGGTSAHRVNNWYDYYSNPAGMLHADIQGLNCFSDPNSPSGEVWYIGTDGGVYESLDQLNTVNNLSLSDLGVSQYYTTLTSLRRPELVVAGSQDQGWQRAELGAPPIGGGSWADFDQLISGDYGHASSANGTHDLVFSPYPGFLLIYEGEDNPNLIGTPNFPSGSNPLWLPPVVADPDDMNRAFLCAKDAIWSCKRQGSSWNWSVYSTSTFGGRRLSALRFSPLNSQLAWAATTDGTLWYSTDHAKNWSQSLTVGPGSHDFYGTAIWASRLDPNEVWVGGSGYSNSPVWRSTDGGLSFQPASAGLPPTLIYSLCESPDQTGRMFAGSVTNAWTWDPATATWEDLTLSGAPLTNYWSVESVRETNTVRFGTYGRGIWDYELDTPGSFPYGNLLSGANTMVLDSTEIPIIGNSYSMTVRNGPANASGWFLISRFRMESVINGGTLLLDNAKVAVQFIISSNAQGEAAFSSLIPSNPALVGSEWYSQAFLADPQQQGGWAFSNGLRVVIG